MHTPVLTPLFIVPGYNTCLMVALCMPIDPDTSLCHMSAGSPLLLGSSAVLARLQQLGCLMM
jgi:hypothetical protein